MRTFLRVEFLYEQTLFHVDEPTEFGARAAVAALLEILTILGRGDVRTDVKKELERHAELLEPLPQPARRRPGAPHRAHRQHRRAAPAARRSRPAAVNPLKECDFLTTIRHRSAIPGGTCMFDLPDYGYWLHLPAAERRRQLDDWTNHIKPICEAVAEVLWLTREATEATPRRAGRPVPARLRSQRAGEPRASAAARHGGVFPEISAGQHRFTIRFVRWRGVDARPVQVSQDVRFLLAICWLKSAVRLVFQRSARRAVRAA